MNFRRSAIERFKKELKGFSVIGHSGHRNIIQHQKHEILRALEAKLIQLKTASHRPCILITGLADGADELAVQAAESCGVSVCILIADRSESEKLDLLNMSLGKTIPSYQVTGTFDDVYTNQADLILANASHILLCWDGIQNNKTGGPSYIFRQVYYSFNKFTSIYLYQLVIARDDSPFPVPAIGMGSSVSFVGHPELNWYENFCTETSRINNRNTQQASSTYQFNPVSWWNKYENFILQFLTPTVLLFLTVILGYIGFEDYQSCLHDADPEVPLLDFLDYSFKAINLATLNSSVLGMELSCSNTVLNIARISGVLFLVYAFILALIKLTGSNLNRVWINTWRFSFMLSRFFHFITRRKMSRKGPFDTIIGLSEHSQHLALDLLKNGHKVLIIADESPSIHKTTCQLAGAVVYSNKPTITRVFELAKVQFSDSIYIFNEDDTINARMLQHVDTYLTETSRGRKPKLFVHVQDTRNRHFINNTTLTAAETFHIYEIIARKLIREFPLDRTNYKYYGLNLVKCDRVQVVILGFSDLGQTLALHIAGNGHYHKNLPINIKIYFEAHEVDRVRRFKNQYPCFFKNGAGFKEDNCARAIQHEVFLQDESVALIEFEELPTAESTLLHDEFSLYSNIKSGQIINIYTCIDNALKSASLTNDILPYLNHLKSQHSCDLQVYCFCNLPDLQEIGIIEEKLNSSANNTPVLCFGNLMDACSFSAIHQNHLDDFSKRLALWYDYLYNKDFNIDDLKEHWLNKDLEELDQEATKLWETEKETIKDANRAAADHIFIKLRSAGVHVKDSLIDTTTKLKAIQSDLAQMEHTRWCAQKMIEGFRPLCDLPDGQQLERDWIANAECKELFQSLKIHLNLKPFHQLTNNEMKKDYTQIEGIPYILNLRR